MHVKTGLYDVLQSNRGGFKMKKKDIIKLIDELYAKHNREIADGEYWMCAFLNFHKELKTRIEGDKLK